MRVAIVGAGALGSVYGARLGKFAGCEVSVVARAPAPPSVVRLERVEDGEVLRWEVPARVTAAPADADVILAFVRYEQLGSLPERVAASSAPVVVMTPMLPVDHARLSAALPGRVLTGMPSVVSYLNKPRELASGLSEPGSRREAGLNDAGAIRYWLPGVATTFIEERQGGAASGAEVDLVKRLTRAEIGAKLAPDVLTRNVATTVSFIPLAMALDAAGSIEALLDEHALLSLAFHAADEGRELGRAVGKAEAWASTLLRFVGPMTLKVGVALARSRAPEAVAYVEQHFGRKLHAQNVVMARRIVDLAVERGTPHEALRKLLERLAHAA
jgi:ketopantoate reductase